MVQGNARLEHLQDGSPHARTTTGASTSKMNSAEGPPFVPPDVFRNDVGERRRKISQRELELLKQKYGVSMQALVCRMRDLGMISDGHFGRIFRWFNKAGYKHDEPGEAVPREQPRRFERMVQHALAEELITRRRAAELLDRDPTSLPEPVLA
ncbi:MAG: hypothetical protein BRD55_11980 [Bacteroidetes bacterium SW_9_63_38]|nr:MAG: hypothetical protein BRD55_11980 [Bacteroidetes bacterium SW_9_63_38]